MAEQARALSQNMERYQVESAAGVSSEAPRPATAPVAPASKAPQVERRGANRPWNGSKTKQPARRRPAMAAAVGGAHGPASDDADWLEF
jgi:hypothetical protein